MSARRIIIGGVIGLAAAGVIAVALSRKQEGDWSAKQVAVVEGFNVPESVVVDPNGVAYVSNVETDKGEYWADDGAGFISRLKPGGELDVLKWASTCAKQGVLHAPKGMCLLKGSLYVADNTRVVRITHEDKPMQPLAPTGAKRLNDMAAHGDSVFVSDTEAGKVFAYDPNGWREIKAPKGVNGITFFKDRMFAVSWDLHEVYELDAAGKDEPKPFGLAGHFKALDGIEVLDDGTFIVSDFDGGKVCTISPDRKKVDTLLTCESPADIGLDRARGLLYVPQFLKNRVLVFQLAKLKK